MKRKLMHTLKKLISVFTAIVLITLSGTGALADDAVTSYTADNAEYNLKVYVPKNTADSVAFYPTSGFDDNNRDFFDTADELLFDTDTESDQKYDIYSMTVCKGMYSFRGNTDDGQSIGGGAFEVTDDKSNGNEISVYLRLSKIYVTNEYDNKKANADDYNISLANKFGTLTSGDAFEDENGYWCYPSLIYADGNSLLYYLSVTPSDSYAKSHGIGKYQKSNIAVFKGNSIYSIKCELPKTTKFTITAPTGAEVCVYDQIMNFNTIGTSPENITDNNDGTSNYIFESAGSSFRVYENGKRTQAGYIPNLAEDDDHTITVVMPDSEPDIQTDSWLGRKESSVLLNINERNRLSLAIGESYTVRAYRAPWQIINTDTDNIMIEPDFHYNIVSGKDVIDIEQITCGNARGNNAKITALKDGVAIVEVSYDAIDIHQNGEIELYGASNPLRTGVFAVTSGEHYGNIGGIDIDAEYHTQYFTGESGYITLSPDGDDVSIEAANITDATLGEWKKADTTDGKFTVPLENGNNVLKITSDGITDYRIIRASKLETVITNKTNPQRVEAVCGGDEITIGFKGLFQWIPKFSGIYNPSGLYAVYQMGSNALESQKSQYNLPETTISLTVPHDAKDRIILTNGRLTGNSLGSHWSAHRQITDAGVPANFNASSVSLTDIPLPDLIIPIQKNTATDEFAEEIPEGNYDNAGGGSDAGADNEKIDVSDLNFNIKKSEADGYVTISFEDYGERVSGESGVTYKTPLGQIIEPVKVPFRSGESIAAVTLRLLKALNIKAEYTGKADSNFYLSSIGDFNLNGKHYSSFGEFDAGSASGWMIKHNNWFINTGASEFEVQDGDNIHWLYTCRLGADIGCDPKDTSAKITRIRFKSDYGTLSPDFADNIEEYTYTVSSSVNRIAMEASLKNYRSKVKYISNGKTYRAMEEIPVSDGTVITIESTFAQYEGDSSSDTDSIKIKIIKKSGSSGGNGTASSDAQSDTNAVADSIGENSVASEEKQPENTDIEAVFYDVKKDDYYYDAVSYVYSKGIMNGTDKGFEPNTQMTRAMLLTVLHRLSGSEKTTPEHGFEDVADSAWYSDAVSWGVLSGITNGTGKNHFSPDKPITREEMILMIYRYSKLKGYDTEIGADISCFEDGEHISEWALDAIKWAYGKSVITGTTKTALSPKNPTTRAQTAVIIMRLERGF